jgi:hypothetical protein
MLRLLVFVVISNWNCAQETLTILRFLETLQPPTQVNLVYNSSIDDSVALLSAGFPDLIIGVSNGQD